MRRVIIESPYAGSSRCGPDDVCGWGDCVRPWASPDTGPQFCYIAFNFPEAPGCTLNSEHVERRLAAILAADVAGSCRLIGIDEEGTLAQLKALRTTGAFCVIRNEPPLSDSPRRA